MYYTSHVFCRCWVLLFSLKMRSIFYFSSREFPNNGICRCTRVDVCHGARTPESATRGGGRSLTEFHTPLPAPASFTCFPTKRLVFSSSNPWVLVELQQALRQAASADREENSEERTEEISGESSGEVVVVRVALPSAAEREQVRATPSACLFSQSQVIG